MKRKLYSKIAAHLNSNEHSIITGSRQTGKTTILEQLYEELLQKKETVFILTFEDPDVLREVNLHPENLLKFVDEKPAKGSGRKIFILIDEIQYAENPSNLLKYVYDKYKGKVKVIATGSSAFYIDRNFKDSLAGRKRIFELYTLDFEEFLIFKNQNEIREQWLNTLSDPHYIAPEKRSIEILFDEYLIYGGYPAVVLEPDVEEKMLLLSELVTTYLKRDVTESNIRDFLRFQNLVKVLASNTGGLVNSNELGKTLKISRPAQENYFYVLQKCFHLHFLKPFFRNLSKELVKMPKVYFNDLGFRNALLNYYEPVENRIDKGALVENYAFIRLRDLYGTDNLHFWRTADGKEIDFVVNESYTKGKAIEIKFNGSEFNEKAYKVFRDSYPDYTLDCIAYKNNNEVSSLLKF